MLGSNSDLRSSFDSGSDPNSDVPDFGVRELSHSDSESNIDNSSDDDEKDGNVPTLPLSHPRQSRGKQRQN